MAFNNERIHLLVVLVLLVITISNVIAGKSDKLIKLRTDELHRTLEAKPIGIKQVRSVLLELNRMFDEEHSSMQRDDPYYKLKDGVKNLVQISNISESNCRTKSMLKVENKTPFSEDFHQFVEICRDKQQDLCMDLLVRSLKPALSKFDDIDKNNLIFFKDSVIGSSKVSPKRFAEWIKIHQKYLDKSGKISNEKILSGLIIVAYEIEGDSAFSLPEDEFKMLLSEAIGNLCDSVVEEVVPILEQFYLLFPKLSTEKRIIEKTDQETLEWLVIGRVCTVYNRLERYYAIKALELQRTKPMRFDKFRCFSLQCFGLKFGDNQRHWMVRAVKNPENSAFELDDNLKINTNQLKLRVGGLQEAEEEDDEYKNVVIECVKKIKPIFEGKTGKKYTSIEVLSYKHQTVAGKNFFVKAQTKSIDGKEEIVHLRIYRDLRGNVELTSYQLNKTKEDELNHFK